MRGGRASTPQATHDIDNNIRTGSRRRRRASAIDPPGDAKETPYAEQGTRRLGHFAEDREEPSEAGKKGGEHSHGSHREGGHGEGGQTHRGGSGNFAEDREKASETGKKGGEHSHGGGRS